MSQQSLKSRLLQGTKADPFYVPEFESDACGGHLGDGSLNEDCDGVIMLRALTDGEQAEINQANVKGQVVRGAPNQRPSEQEVDVAASVGGMMTGRRIAAAYGMSTGGEKWSVSEVARLRSSAVQRISKRVMEISGDDGLADEAATFRDDAGGAVDRDPASDGDAAGGDTG